MKNLNYAILIVLITISGLASCSKDDSSPKLYTNDSSAVHINISIDNSSSTLKSNPLSDDINARTILNNKEQISITAGNQEALIYENNNGTCQPLNDSTYIKWISSSMNFKAYYPVGKNDASMTSFTIPYNQSDLSSIVAADYMTADTTITKNDNINISLRRQTALVNVIISEITAVKTVNGENIRQVSNVYIYSPKRYLNISPSSTQCITPYTSTEKDGYGTFDTCYSALILPSDAQEDKTFIKLKNSFGANIDFKNIPKMEAGYSYTYRIQVNDYTINILSTEKKKWSTGNIISPCCPFYDKNFEAAIIDADESDALTTSPIDVTDPDQLAALHAISELNISTNSWPEDYSINSAHGIEYLTGLTDFNCNVNGINRLDLSKNTKLVNLNCILNNICKLNISNCPNLKNLDCGDTALKELDISHNPKLESLTCAFTRISEIDVSKNTELTFLNISYNRIKTLNLSNNKKLTNVLCFNNMLSDLDFSYASISNNYYLHCGNQTSDGSTPQNLTLTLRADQLEYWNSSLSGDHNNLNVVLK